MDIVKLMRRSLLAYQVADEGETAASRIWSMN